MILPLFVLCDLSVDNPVGSCLFQADGFRRTGICHLIFHQYSRYMAIPQCHIVKTGSILFFHRNMRFISTICQQDMNPRLILRPDAAVYRFRNLRMLITASIHFRMQLFQTDHFRFLTQKSMNILRPFHLTIR